MQNNSYIMKRIYLTLSLFLGIVCISCESNVKSNNETADQDVVTTKKKIEVTKHPDTIIDGVRVYNLKGSNVKAKEISLEESINIFEISVNKANTCQQLIKACATFDSNVRKICKENPNIKLVDIENRDDVKSIRRISEEKSLELCQTQQM